MTDELKNRIAEHEPGILGRENLIETSVMIPLFKSENGKVLSDRRLLLQKRAEHLEHQPGEICFPGGLIEHGDDSPAETAVRETSEELGVETDTITLWGELDYMLMPWALKIHCFVGTIPDPEDLEPDPAEVDEFFTVQLETALETEPERYDVPLKPEPQDDFPFEKIPKGRDYPWMTRTLPELFFEFEDRVVWGITARFLNRFLTMVKASVRDGTS